MNRWTVDLLLVAALWLALVLELRDVWLPWFRPVADDGFRDREPVEVV